MGTARLVRGRFLSLRQVEFVEASHALGGSAVRVMFRHILPNALGPIIVATTLAVGGAIMLESALSFLGFGVQPPTPTWGNLLNESREWLSIAPWLAIFPGLTNFNYRTRRKLFGRRLCATPSTLNLKLLSFKKEFG